MKCNFWIVTLCAFLIIVINVGWSIPMRIAITCNAIIILLDTIKQAWRLYREHREASNNNIHRGKNAIQ